MTSLAASVAGLGGGQMTGKADLLLCPGGA